MKPFLKLHVAGFLASAAALSAVHAAEASGKWKSEFDTQVGHLKYTYELRADGEKLTGTYAGQFGQSQLKGTVKGNNADWTFENDQVGTISYSGTIDGTKMKGKVQYGAVGSGTFTAEKSK